jgi:hypothetical protein
MRFWDSSALVPLVVREEASAEAEGWFAEDSEIVAWTLAPTEILSAIRRLGREGRISSRGANDAEARTIDLISRAHVVADLELVKSTAARVLRLHPLRAADALQLAAALVWASGRPSDRVLLTVDVKLGQAAEREGFRVIPDA